jgi:4-hydroxy-tetrahydrodipicolinate synthase
MEPARYLHSRLERLMAALAKDNPAAVKYALCLLGLMPPNTRLPIVELANSAKIEIATAIAQLGDQDLANRSKPAFASTR